MPCTHSPHLSAVRGVFACWQLEPWKQGKKTGTQEGVPCLPLETWVNNSWVYILDRVSWQNPSYIIPLPRGRSGSTQPILGHNLKGGVVHHHQRKFSGKLPIYELLGSLTGIVVLAVVVRSSSSPSNSSPSSSSRSSSSPSSSSPSSSSRSSSSPSSSSPSSSSRSSSSP